ncbi:MAG: hypothetical protein SFY69_07820 [Planctomycetota bacterium]|nr:hypothetical protein [Planctomycetota bacterium]
MNPRALLGRLNLLQQQRLFKWIATAVIAAAAVAGCLAYGAMIAAPRTPEVATTPATPGAPGTGLESTDASEQAARAMVQEIVAAGSDPWSVFVMIVLGALVLVGAAWLGLGLTYLAVLAAGAAVTGVALATGWRSSVVPVSMGVLALTLAFVTLMRLVRAGLDSSNPVFAIARNVLAEAVRLRLSLVFIVLLIFMLAALPQLLDETQPLRYRVQAFIQWGTGGAFYLIALLTVVFAVATVTFDQRDKTIWQTMTKPVAAWQYVLGKWLGVWVLSGVLLAVAGSGVFLFIEYLRHQPAAGEQDAYMTREGRVSEDRLLLERQILTARESRDIDPFPVDEAQFEQNLIARAEAEVQRLQESLSTTTTREILREEMIASLRKDLRKSVQMAYRNIPPGLGQHYTFSGLGAARERPDPLFLRFTVNAGSNAPDALYRLTFKIGNSEPQVQEVVLGQPQTIPLLPGSIGPDGTLAVQVINGDVYQETSNPESISFPPDGLRVSYAAGSFRSNYVRVMGVLWVKLGFLAMVGVFAGTFLSFPVACLVSLTIFFAAEGATFLRAALDNYWTADKEGKTLYLNLAISAIGEVVAWVFQVYGGLRPTAKLVEGLRLAWRDVALGTGVTALWTLLLFAGGTLALRRRELATYSGQ